MNAQRDALSIAYRLSFLIFYYVTCFAGPVTPVLERDSSGDSLELKVCHRIFAEVDAFRYFYSRNLSGVILGSPPNAQTVSHLPFRQFLPSLISPQILSALS